MSDARAEVADGLILQRQNALFAGHQLGAENGAAIASLVETCKMVDIEPYALSNVLARIITRSDPKPIYLAAPHSMTEGIQFWVAPRGLIPMSLDTNSALERFSTVMNRRQIPIWRDF